MFVTEITGGWGKLQNKELHEFWSSPDTSIIRAI
jgi:hypothetical protein